MPKKVERNILKERKQSRILSPLMIIFALYAITTLYYSVAIYFSKEIGGLNIYLAAILAGASGGLWSLGINIGYKHFLWTKNCSDEEWEAHWRTEKSFNNYLLGIIAKIFVFSVIIIVAFTYIDMMKLY